MSVLLEWDLPHVGRRAGSNVTFPNPLLAPLASAACAQDPGPMPADREEVPYSANEERE
jgi:hypothetical protein